MQDFQLFATPWWVNLLILVPFLAFLWWRQRGLQLTSRHLLLTAVFAVGFGFIEGAVVVYLRAAVGLLPGYAGTLADVAQLSSEIYRSAAALDELPRSLLTVEVWREAATMIVLVAVTLLAARSFRERAAVFLWVFALWDISYYATLWATVRWPASLTTPDILFLIPVPWQSQVWYPILVSTLTALAVLAARRDDASARCFRGVADE